MSALESEAKKAGKEKKQPTFREKAYQVGTVVLSNPLPSLGGAIDVMVVKQPDGTLKSSPFYVRFPGWLRRHGKDVTVTVNGRITSLKMHLGLKGDAYFLPDGASSSDEDEPTSAVDNTPEGVRGLIIPTGDGPEPEPGLATPAPRKAVSTGGGVGTGGSDDLDSSLASEVTGLLGGAGVGAGVDSGEGEGAGEGPQEAPLGTSAPALCSVSSVGRRRSRLSDGMSVLGGRGPAPPSPAEEEGARCLQDAVRRALAEEEGGAASETNESGAAPRRSTEPSVSVSDTAAWPGPAAVSPTPAAPWTAGGLPEPGAARRISLSFPAAPGPTESKPPGLPLGRTSFSSAPAGLSAEAAPGPRPPSQPPSPSPAPDLFPPGLSISSIGTLAEEITPSPQRNREAAPSLDDRAAGPNWMRGGTVPGGAMAAAESHQPVSVVGFSAPTQSEATAAPPATDAAPTPNRTGAASSSAPSPPLPPGASPREPPTARAAGLLTSELGRSRVDLEDAVSNSNSQQLIPPLTPSECLIDLSPAPPTPSSPPADPFRRRDADSDTAASSPASTSAAAAAGTAGSPAPRASRPLPIPHLREGCLQLSLCWGMLQRGMAPEVADRVFASNRIHQDLFVGTAAELMRDPNLAVRFGSGGTIIPWQDAAPAVLAFLAFGPEAAVAVSAKMEAGGFGQPGVGAGGAGAGYSESPQRGSWRLWPFNWAASRVLGTSPPPGGLPVEDLAKQRLASRTTPSSPNRAIFGRTPPPLGTTPPPHASLPAAAAAAAASDPAVSASAARAAAEKAAARELNSELHLNRTPTSDQLSSLSLNVGQNDISFRCGNTEVRAYVYLLDWSTRLIISDIDGTITKSDALGHVFSLVGRDWSHAGIAKLFQAARANGYQLMYLSSRAIVQASMTRDYLHTLRQGAETLPLGPVILSPDGLLRSVTREMILRRPHEFKIASLQNIRSLFPQDCNPFYAGFGNRATDEVSYLHVGVPLGKVFTINPRGEISSVHTSTPPLRSLDEIFAEVDSVFPALDGVQGGEDDAYGGYRYWKAPLPEIIVDDPPHSSSSSTPTKPPPAEKAASEGPPPTAAVAQKKAAGGSPVFARLFSSTVVATSVAGAAAVAAPPPPLPIPLPAASAVRNGAGSNGAAAPGGRNGHRGGDHGAEDSSSVNGAKRGPGPGADGPEPQTNPRAGTGAGSDAGRTSAASPLPLSDTASRRHSRQSSGGGAAEAEPERSAHSHDGRQDGSDFFTPYIWGM